VFFHLEHSDTGSSARAGTLITSHGIIETPVFMPVGTAGTVKAVHTRELLNDINNPVILANTYHLFLRPGMDVIAAAGGLHKFMGWERAILTDSGGYQVFSLASQRKLSEEGVMFNSHIDGSKYFFTPESVVEAQRIIGSDIMMALDECTPFPCPVSDARQSMELTHRWLVRGVEKFHNSQPVYGNDQFFFPIVQGSTYESLRSESAAFVASLNCDGNAIGGLSVGEPAEVMYAMIAAANKWLPAAKPRYLMGVGMPENILEAIALGVDMFDCVIPTRNGRNGMLFTMNGVINIRNEKWRKDMTPLDPDGTIFSDQQYSRAYLRHLVMAGEILGAQIATLHNLSFFSRLVAEARKQIINNTFVQWKNNMLSMITQRL